MMSILARVMPVLRLAERTLLAVVMVTMSVLYFTNVVVRQVSPRLASEVAWIEAATLIALAWLVFVGLGIALEQRRHVAMTVFLDNLSPSVARILHKMINLTGLVFCIFLVNASYDLAVRIYHSGQVSPTLGVSMVALYAPLPVGFTLLGLRYLLELIGVQDRFTIRTSGPEH